MTLERAAEILNPQHREHYDSLETVEEACRLGMEALEMRIPKKLILKPANIMEGENLHCPVCNSIIIAIRRGHRIGAYHKFCYNCGQALKLEGTE